MSHGSQGKFIDTLMYLTNVLQQWYQRRKLDAMCYVGHKFEDPVGHEEPCACTDDDYEW